MVVAGAGAGETLGVVTGFALAPALPLSLDAEVLNPLSAEPVSEVAAGAEESSLPLAAGLAEA